MQIDEKPRAERSELKIEPVRPEDRKVVEAQIGQHKGGWVDLPDHAWANDERTAVFHFLDDLVPASLAFSMYAALSQLPLNEVDFLECDGGGFIRIQFNW